MAKDKHKQIYGDDDQVLYDLLMQREDEVNKLVDLATDKALKKRAVSYKKNKKMKDTSFNSGKQAKVALRDVDDETFDLDVVDGGNDEAIIAEKSTKKKGLFGKKDKKAKKQKQEKPKKEKKKKGKKIVNGILLLMIIALSAAIGYPYIKDYIPTEVNGPVSSVDPVITETPTPTETPVSSADVEQGVTGRLSSLDPNYTYSVDDTLSLADSFNTTLVNYYNEYINIVNNYSNTTIKSDTERYLQMIQQDRITISDYTTVFYAYGGDEYLNTIIARYDNAVNLLSDLLSIDDEKAFKDTVNEYIQQENYLSGNSKNSLINYLSNNGIEYQDNGSYVTFDFIGEEVPEESATPTEEPISTDTPVETDTPVVTDTPVAPEEAISTEAPVESPLVSATPEQ